MNKTDRRRLERMYNHYYKLALYCDLNTCVYCSDNRECLDHVPALSLIESINIQEYKDKGGNFLFYPACNKCNEYLSNLNQIDIYERLLHLEEKYTKKLKTCPSWTQKEIEELGYNLQTLIMSKKSKYDYYKNKLDGIKNNIIKYLIQKQA